MPNLMNDFAFKYVFGADTIESNNALKGLLETFLERKIVSVQLKNPELTKNLEMTKNSKFDILVRFDDSVRVDIEMQVFIDLDELRKDLFIIVQGYMENKILKESFIQRQTNRMC